MKKNGFTLIELVVVIIILGILAATAAPKYIELQRDALIAKMETIEGSLNSASTLTYAKSAVSGRQGLENSSITVAGSEVETRFGYPKVAWESSLREVLDVPVDPVSINTQAVCDSSEDFCVNQAINLAGITGLAGRSLVIYPVGKTVNDLCYVYYHLPQDSSSPNIGLISGGC